MTGKYLLASDERARNWIVYEDDMAWAQCQALTKLGLKDVVLPTNTFRYGHVELPEGLANIDSLQDVQIDDMVKPLVRRVIRLRDCVHWLKENMHGTK